MMDEAHFAMTMPEQTFDFRMVSGPDRAYIVVKEVSDGVAHVPGPAYPREVNHERRPAHAGRGASEGKVNPNPRRQRNISFRR